MINHLLTTDDVVRCRTVASRWNVGCRFGELGDIFFEFLENDPFVRHWYRDVEGNRVRTKSIQLWNVSGNGGFMHPRQLPSHVR